MSEVLIDLPEPREFVVACHTAGCENEEISVPVSVAVPEGMLPYVICGPCTAQITDVVPV